MARSSCRSARPAAATVTNGPGHRDRRSYGHTVAGDAAPYSGCPSPSFNGHEPGLGVARAPGKPCGYKVCPERPHYDAIPGLDGESDSDMVRESSSYTGVRTPSQARRTRRLRLKLRLTDGPPSDADESAGRCFQPAAMALAFKFQPTAMAAGAETRAWPALPVTWQTYLRVRLWMTRMS